MRAARIVFQPCHQYHDSPDWRAVRALLPRIGRIHFADYEVRRTEANAGSSNWSPTWRTERARAGGGILVDHGAHVFYQLRAILGEPDTVQANVRTLHHGYAVEDTALVVLDFGDCLARVNLTWAARRRGIRFQFVGDRGELVGDDEGAAYAETEEEIRFGDGMSRGSAHSDWYAPMFRAFTERVRRGEAKGEGLDEAVYVMRLISKAYASSSEGRSLAFAAPEEERMAATESSSPPAAAMTAMASAPRSSLLGPSASARPWMVRVTAALALRRGDVTFHDRSAPGGGSDHGAPRWIGRRGRAEPAGRRFQAARWLALTRLVHARPASAFQAMTVDCLLHSPRARASLRVCISSAAGRPPAHVGLQLHRNDHPPTRAGLLLAGAAASRHRRPLWVRAGRVGRAGLVRGGHRPRPAVRPRGGEGGAAAGSSGAEAAGLANARLGLAAMGRPRALALSFGAALASWALEGNVTAVSLKAVGLPMSYSTALLVLLAVNLALAFPIAPPGNIGTIEVGATLALVGLGVPKEQALAFGIVYHVLQVVPVGVLGILFATRRSDDPVAV